MQTRKRAREEESKTKQSVGKQAGLKPVKEIAKERKIVKKSVEKKKEVKKSAEKERKVKKSAEKKKVVKKTTSTEMIVKESEKRYPHLYPFAPISKFEQIYWKGYSDQSLFALWYAASVTNCDCISPGKLKVSEKEAVLIRTSKNIRVDDNECRGMDKILYFLSLRRAKETGEHSHHASVLIIDRENKRFTISNPWGTESHEQTYANHDKIIEKWVKENFAEDFERDFGADLCPKVQSTVEPAHSGWCVLWTSWWIHQLLVRKQPYKMPSLEELKKQIIKYYNELMIFRESKLTEIRPHLNENQKLYISRFLPGEQFSKKQRDWIELCIRNELSGRAFLCRIKKSKEIEAPKSLKKARRK